MYRLADLPPTPIATLVSARNTALEMGLHHVYVGNVVTENGMNTYCSGCGRMIIERQGYTVVTIGVDEGLCTHCSEPVPGVWK